MSCIYFPNFIQKQILCLRLSFLLFFLLPYSLIAQQNIPLKGHPEAHAHNDYEHKRPLFDALEQGFSSVEADVWLIKGELYVKHNKPLSVSNTPSLEELYLLPLKKIYEERRNGLYENLDRPFFLMIDIKSEASSTYRVLKEKLVAYRSLLLGEKPPLLIFLSGNRPIELVQSERNPFVGIDGRPDDLGKGYSPEFMPVISQRFSKIIKWNGKAPILPEQFAVLEALAKSCHAEGKLLRLWASPETELCWKKLREAGVDLINTDKLEALHLFLLENE
ncbi:MAG: phosphatidylinositol-specific phospholipase C/glycerophosphodiester phosphodiesterase family protein [Bacteroidota bacterium]